MKNLIALICPEGKNLHIKPGESYTADWVVSDDQAKSLRYVSFHDKQKNRSYLTGRITNIETRPDGRKRIYFIPTSDFTIPGDRLNWGQEKAYAKMKTV